MVLRRGNVAGQHEQRFFAVHFAGVNVAHGKDDELAVFFRFRRVAHRGIGDNDERQLAAFMARAQFAEPNQLRFLGELFAERRDIGMARGRLVLAGFGNGSRRRTISDGIEP